VLDNLKAEEAQPILTELWTINANTVTKFPQYNKIEKQFAKTGMSEQSLLCVKLAKSAFKAIGEDDVAINTFKKRSAPDCTFSTVCIFITKEYSNQVKDNKP
jgi:hypothetical protein